MIICVDVGNTNIVFGFYEQDNLLNTCRLETKSLYSYDEYGSRLINYLKYVGKGITDVSGVIISSVVPTIDYNLEEAFKKYFKIVPIFVSYDMPLGINIQLDDPKQIGADLLVGAYQAVNKYHAPAIVIDMGTATTLVAIDRNHNFLGGIIYPGVLESYSNLIKSTSLLKAAKIQIPKKVIGNDTVTSLQSGMIFGSACAIQGLVQLVKKEMNDKDIKVILTGGISSYIKDYIVEAIHDENLLLDGLLAIYKNVSK